MTNHKDERTPESETTVGHEVERTFELETTIGHKAEGLWTCHISPFGRLKTLEVLVSKFVS